MVVGVADCVVVVDVVDCVGVVVDYAVVVGVVDVVVVDGLLTTGAGSKVPSPDVLDLFVGLLVVLAALLLPLNSEVMSLPTAFPTAVAEIMRGTAI